MRSKLLCKLSAVGALAICALLALSPAHATGAFGTNLILNGDAEAGVAGTTPGWVTTGGFTSAAYGDPNWIPSDAPGPADRGSNFFVGGSKTPSSTAFQSIDVSFGSNQIDTGYITFDISAYMGGWRTDDDNVVVGLSFKDAGGTTLNRSSLGPVLAADRSSVTGLIYIENSGSVPIGTRSIDVLLNTSRTTGNDDDAYMDNLSLVLTDNSPVPEPASIVTLFAGTVGVLGLYRKRK